MNVLFLTAYPPVLNMHGGGVRMYHNIRILAREHSVRVISFIENEREREALRSVADICESVTPVLRVPDFRPHWLSLDPFLAREFHTPQMFKEIDAAFRKAKVDVLQCEYLQMAQYRRAGVFSILTILENLSENAYEGFRRERDPVEKLRLYYRWMQLVRYEIGATRRFERVVTMTNRDAAYLHSYSPSANIRAIPIGIDAVEFEPLPEECDQPLEVLFIGNFRHTPNVEAADFIVREMAPFFPDVRFVMPGSNLPSRFANHRNVVFMGYAPDTRILYRRPNTIVVAPLFSGTGQRVKLLEAFSMACPVVTTSIGAFGFPIHCGAEAMLAESATEFRDALRQLIASESLRRNLGERGRKMILQNFQWDRIGSEMLSLVGEVRT